jgi:hypothetical protein
VLKSIGSVNRPLCITFGNIHQAPRSSAISQLLERFIPRLRRTLRKNLARLTCVFLRLALGVRYGYGGLHLTSVARALPQGVQFKSSYKWLSRFLKCK